MPNNWTDIAIILVVAWSLADGARRGFILSIVDLAVFCLSVVISVMFYVQLGELISVQWSLPPLVARPAAFAALWIVTSMVAGFVGRAVGAPFAALLRGSALDILMSVVPSAAKGLLVAGFALTILLAIPAPDEGLPGHEPLLAVRESIQESQLATELVQRMAGFDRLAREVVGEPLSQTLTLLTIKPGTDEHVALDFKVESPAPDPTAEARMLELLNAERVRAGLAPLLRDPTLDKVARAYSVEMLQRGYFSHESLDGRSPFTRMREGGVQFSVAGENLALAPTAALAHQGLMDSPGHKANILRPEFGRVGIGAADADGRGRMFTQNFAN